MVNTIVKAAAVRISPVLYSRQGTVEIELKIEMPDAPPPLDFGPSPEKK